MNAATVAERHTNTPGQAIASPAAAETGLLPEYGQPGARPRYLHAMARVLQDAVVLVLAVLLLPVVIYLVGTPIALGVRAVMAIVRLVF